MTLKRRGVSLTKHRPYRPEERESLLAALKANGGNILRTSREHGVDPKTLRSWRDQGIHSLPEKAGDLAESYLERVRQVREAALTRMLELIPQETDLHKVSGAAKLLSEMALTQEVICARLAHEDRSVSTRIMTA